VFEGVDRCGKTTQCARLVEGLRESGVRVSSSSSSSSSSSAATTSKRGAFFWFLFQPLLVPSPPSRDLFPASESKQNEKQKKTPRQIKAEMWRFPDRTTEIGTMIDAYLGRSKELDDAAVHLLFSANRWEKRARLLRELHEGTTLVCDRYAFSGVAFTAAKNRPGLGFDWCRAPDEGLPAPDAVLYLDLDPAEAEKRGGFGAERYESPEMLRTVWEAFGEISRFVDGRCTRWLRVDASGSVEEVGERVGEAARSAVEAAAKGEAPLRSLWDGTGGVVGWPPAEGDLSSADEKKR